MSDLSNYSLWAKHFKCFGEEPEGFVEIKPINVIVGRNNAGKSSLLDLIEAICMLAANHPFEKFKRSRNEPEVYYGSVVAHDIVKKVFPENTSGGSFPANMSHYDWGKRLIGNRIIVSAKNQSKDNRIAEHPENQEFNAHFSGLIGVERYISQIVQEIPNPFASKTFLRIDAERNIQPEAANNALNVSSDGSGITNLIRAFTTQMDKDDRFVHKELVTALNKILHPSVKIERLQAKDTGGTWEIVLEEEGKGNVALSQSGSGLKTLIHVLSALILQPVLSDRTLSDYVFAFEELENNLHPYLLRQLLSVIFEKVEQERCHVFLTTHSSVTINAVSANKNAQIIHVTNENGVSRCRVAKTYVDNKGVLDDLDIRASDLLQSNGIIWVEGPSDRTYLNRWIDLWSDGKLKEGLHYQCVIYGGKLLNHLSAATPGDVSGVAMLSVNRNAYVLIDSDRKSDAEELNSTKRRILNEIENIGGGGWVTYGKAIENYIPQEVLTKIFPMYNEGSLSQHDDVCVQMDKFEIGGKKYTSKNKKILLAEEACTHMTRENLLVVQDLNKQMEKLIATIKKWNNI